jgi:glycosyltransferase involved in cell wall biosynthesis
MRILQILATPRAEGTPNLVLDWLTVSGHQQEVFVMNRTPADLTQELRKRASWYGEAELFRGRGSRKFLRIAATVWRVCRKRQPDLVLCWPTGFANWICLGARLAGVRLLLVYCGNPPCRGFRADWLTRYVMWPLAALRARCVCCSDYVRDAFCEVPFISRNLFAAVHNCARVKEVRSRALQERARRPTGAPPTAIMVATLERHKDHRTLLEAAQRVVRRLNGFQLLLVGDGSLRAELEEIVSKLGIASAVSFLGTRRNVPELLGRADLFVFATTPAEGLGSVLIEALAAELSVLASDVPACRELLCDGKYGRLVRAADPMALADAIINHFEDKPLTPAGTEAYLARFTPETMMDRYLELAR